MILVVPSDPLHPRRPDEHFAEEAAAARELGVRVELVDHEALTRPGAADPVPRIAREDHRCTAVYRGWMMRSEPYATFAEALAEKNIALRTDPKQYQRAHELPGWYEALSSLTPESFWTRGSSLEDVRDGCRKLRSGAAVLRDYSKSMKHYWNEAAFIPNVADGDGACKVAARFLELREDSFVGGFVLRRFEALHADEVRTWWVDGKCVLTTPHPDSKSSDLPTVGIEHLEHVAPLIACLGLPFVTADLALRDDGVWRVVELGDGQVSDRSRATPAVDFLRSVLGEPR